jgi:hypothetical protein
MILAARITRHIILPLQDPPLIAREYYNLP